MTQRLGVGEKAIADHCQTPYNQAVSGLREKAERLAAKKWVDGCVQINIVKALPPEVLAYLPTGSHLIVVGEQGHNKCIELENAVPQLLSAIAASKWDDTIPSRISPRLTPSLVEVLECHPTAMELWTEAAVLDAKGEAFNKEIQEFLVTTDFTTAEQFIWSCQPLASLMNAISGTDGKGTGSRRYYRSRRYDGMEILLDTLKDRRYLSRDKMRRPRRVHPFPDHLTTLCGEAQVILASLPGKKK
jgi:hypothetical protein